MRPRPWLLPPEPQNSQGQAMQLEGRWQGTGEPLTPFSHLAAMLGGHGRRRESMRFISLVTTASYLPAMRSRSWTTCALHVKAEDRLVHHPAAL